MFGTFFQHQQLRRYIVAFGQFFNKLEVHRTDASGAEVQRLVVPLDYSPKERWLTRLMQDPQFLQGVEAILPRMSFEAPTMHYDASRHLNTQHSLIFTAADGSKLTRMYVGVPYTLAFDLAILTKLQSDGQQIVEQILPYFSPDLFFAMMPVPEFGLTDNIPLTLQSVTTSDNYEGDFDKRRAIMWNLAFSMKVFLYGPVRDQKRITQVIIDLYDSPYGADIADPPVDIINEDGSGLITEDETGRLLDEATANTYTDIGRVSRVEAVAAPNQDPLPSDNVVSTTTITEYSGDVKRNRVLDDEPTGN